MTARLSRSLFLFALIRIFLWGITPLWAQQDSTVLFPVSGRVTDTSGESIPFATVRIRPQASADSTQFWGQVTDANGFFRIGLPAAGNYEIHITCIGMEPLTQSFRTTRTQGHSLGNLKMKEGRTELAGVTVTQTRKLVKIEIDKISYDINKDPESRTSNLLRMLRKVPLITVDGRGNIQVNGSSNFTIYQNGKRNSMFRSNGKEVLRSIPASSIKRIEVMTKPG